MSNHFNPMVRGAGDTDQSAEQHCGKCTMLGPIAPCDGCYYGTTHRAASYGPSFPIALCKCGTRLHFERHDYRPEWQCWCRDCVDGDYDYETGGTVATYPIGDGKTLFDALDDYAIRCDVETESLFAKEGT